jgi:diacylglycerol diphosphate phosphatase / phosphatidate phosphatase
MSPPSQLGAAGALARFWLRSHAADYIALGILVAGWLLVSFPSFARMIY